MRQITENEFYHRFSIQPNHLQKREEFGGMYETYGEENEYVSKLSEKENRVWTIVDNDGLFYLITGYNHVNRQGYIVTNEAYTEEMEVMLDDPRFNVIDIEIADQYALTQFTSYDHPRYKAFMEGIFYAEQQAKDKCVRLLDWMGEHINITSDGFFSIEDEQELTQDEILDRFYHDNLKKF